MPILGRRPFIKRDLNLLREEIRKSDDLLYSVVDLVPCEEERRQLQPLRKAKTSPNLPLHCQSTTVGGINSFQDEGSLDYLDLILPSIGQKTQEEKYPVASSDHHLLDDGNGLKTQNTDSKCHIRYSTTLSNPLHLNSKGAVLGHDNLRATHFFERLEVDDFYEKHFFKKEGIQNISPNYSMSNMEETFKVALSEYFNEVDKEKDILLEELKNMQSQLVKHGKLERKDAESNHKKEKLIKKLTSNGKVLVREIERLKEDLMISQKQNAALTEENKKLISDVDFERGQIPHLQLEVKTLLEENSYLKTLADDSRKLKEQERELHELEHQISFQQNLCNEYSLEIKDKDKQIKNLQDRILTLEEQVIKVNQLTKEREQLYGVVAERDQLRFNYESMQKVADSLESKLKEFTDHNDVLKQSLGAVKCTNDERLEEIRHLQRTCKNLEHVRVTDGQDLENQQETIRQLHNENIILGRQIEALKKDLNVNKMTMDTVKYEEELLKEELKVTHRKLAEMEGVNKRWQAREQELLEEMAEAKTKIAYLNNSNQVSEERAKSAQDELDRTVEKLNQVQLAFERKGDRETELQREILVYVKKCSKLEQDLLLMNKKMIKLRKNLEDCEKERGSKQVECLDLQEKLSAKESALQSEKERLGHLQQQLDATRKRCLNLESEIEEREREKRCLRNEIDGKENKCEHLEHELERFKSDSNRLRQELKNSAVIIDELNEKLRNSYREKKETELKCESYFSDTRCKEDEIVALKKDLEDKVKECKAFKATICKKDDEIEDKNKLHLQIVKQLDMTRQENMKYENEIANLRNCLDEKNDESSSNKRVVEQLEDDLDNSRRKYLKLDATYRANLEQNENLEREILENRKKIMEMSLVKNELENSEVARRKEVEISRKNLVALEKHCEELERALQDASVIKEKDKRQLEHLEDDRRKLLKERETLNDICKEREQQLSRIELKNQKLNSVDEERIRYYNEAENLKKELSELRENLIHTERKRKAKYNECDEVKRTASDLQRSLTEYKDENENLRRKNKSISKEIEVLSKSLERAENTLASEADEMTKLKRHFDTELGRQEEIKAELEKLQEREKELVVDREKAKVKISDLEALNHDTMKESGKMTIELVAAQEKIKQNEAELASIHLQHNRMSESLNVMKREVVQQSTSMESVKGERDKLVAQLSSYSMRVEQLTEDLGRKSVEHEKLSKEMSTLREEYQIKVGNLLSDKSQLVNDYNELKNRIVELEMERDLQKRGMHDLDHHLSQSEQEVKRLEEELKRALTMKAKLEGKVEEAVQRGEEKEESLRDMSLKLEHCEKNRLQILKEKDVISLDNEQLRSHHTVLLDKVNNLGNQITVMERNEEHLAGDKVTLEKERQEVLSELQRARCELEQYEERNRKVSTELAQTRERLSHSEREKEAILAHKTQYDESEERLREEVTQLRRAVKEKEEIIEKLHEDVNLLNFQNQDVRILLDNERASRNAERESLLAELSSIKRNNSENLSTKGNLEAEIRMLKKQQNEYENKLKTLEEQKRVEDDRSQQRRYSEMSNYLDEINKLKKQLKTAEDTKQNDINQLTQQLTSVQESKDKEILALQSRLVDNDHRALEIEQLRSRGEDIHNLRLQIKDLERELEITRKTGQEVTPEVEVLRGKLEWYEVNKREHENDRKRLIEELEDQGFELSKLQSTVNAYIIEKESYKKEIESLRRDLNKTIKEKEQDKEKMTTEIRVFQTDRNDIDKIRRENEKLREQVESSSVLRSQLERAEQESQGLRQELESVQSAAKHYENALQENKIRKRELKEIESKYLSTIERIEGEKKELLDRIRKLQGQSEDAPRRTSEPIPRKPSPVLRSTLYIEPEQEGNFDPVTLTIKPSEIKKSQAYLVTQRKEKREKATLQAGNTSASINLSRSKPFQRSVDDLLRETDFRDSPQEPQPRPSSTDPRISASKSHNSEYDRFNHHQERSMPYIRSRPTDLDIHDSRDDESSALGQTPSEIRASFESLLSIGSVGSEDTQGEQTSKRGGKFVNRLVADYESRQKKKPPKSGTTKRKVDIFS